MNNKFLLNVKICGSMALGQQFTGKTPVTGKKVLLIAKVIPSDVVLLLTSFFFR